MAIQRETFALDAWVTFSLLLELIPAAIGTAVGDLARCGLDSCRPVTDSLRAVPGECGFRLLAQLRRLPRPNAGRSAGLKTGHQAVQLRGAIRKSIG